MKKKEVGIPISWRPPPPVTHIVVSQGNTQMGNRDFVAAHHLRNMIMETYDI